MGAVVGGWCVLEIKALFYGMRWDGIFGDVYKEDSLEILSGGKNDGGMGE